MEFDKKYPTTKFIGLTLDLTLEESVNKLFHSLKGVVTTIGRCLELVDTSEEWDFGLNMLPADILVSNAGVVSEYGPKLGDTSTEKFMDAMVSYSVY